MPVSPQSYDLITVAELIEYANLQQATLTVEDIGQECISGFSMAFYRYAGRTPGLYTAIQTLDEFYDGNGGAILWPDNAPVNTVTGLFVNGEAIPQSTSVDVPGWFIDRDQHSIKMRSAPWAASAATFSNTDWGVWAGVCPYRFSHGLGNVEVQYTAGYDACPPDLLLAALKQCTIYLNRRLREDERSHGIPGTGTTSYASWSWSPDVLQLAGGLKRVAAY